MTTQVDCKLNNGKNDISYAASIFSQLNDDAQKAILDLLKSFISSNQREIMEINKSI